MPCGRTFFFNAESVLIKKLVKSGGVIARSDDDDKVNLGNDSLPAIPGLDQQKGITTNDKKMCCGSISIVAEDVPGVDGIRRV